MIGFGKLDEAQRKAVIHKRGPLLIIAGAGTGKTAVITHRIAWLIKNKLAKPGEILALTFTDKSAQEMEERVDQILPYGYYDLEVSTFHSFCKKILEEEGLNIGLNPDFKVIDASEASFLLRENFDRLKLSYYRPLGNPFRFIQALTAHFARCKDYKILPEAYLKYAFSIKDKEEKERLKEVARAYKIYQELLLSKNLLDFGDLLIYSYRLFKKRKSILKKYQEKFKYILVDEFQDTNWIQYQLLKLLAPPQRNLTVCADDDQAIYRFRGASYGNIINFQKDFPDCKIVCLKKNYRSFQKLLNFAYQLIQKNNPDRLEYQISLDKKLKASQGEGILKCFSYKSLEEEVEGVIKKIKEILKNDKNLNLSEIAILVRTNDSATPFLRALEREGIPYQFRGSKGLYMVNPILDLISYFKIILDPYLNQPFYRILSSEILNLAPEEIAKINHFSRKKSRSLYESFSDSSLIKELKKETQEKIIFLKKLIKEGAELAKRKKVSEVFIFFLEKSGYLKKLLKKSKIVEINYLSSFYRRIKDFEEKDSQGTLLPFLSQIEIEFELGGGKFEPEFEKSPDVLNILTIHSAKGLEFDYVFLVNLVERRFPTIKKRDPIELPIKLIKEILPQGDFHLQEERRLFYVGLTRARKGVFLTFAENYGGVKKRKPSRFILEMNLRPKKEISLPSSIFLIKRTSFSKKESLTLPPYFSFSQLEAFRNCPLQYKFAHLLKIPVRGKGTYSFGKTIHDTLFKFLKLAFQEKVDFKKLLKIYKECWIDDWYPSETIKKERYLAGIEALKKFYKIFKKEIPQVAILNKKPALEVSFKLKLSEDVLIGRIDRIDYFKEGVEIIDYKTGSLKKKLKKVDKSQLLIYWLGAREALKLKPKLLSYFFVEEGKKLSFSPSEIEIKEEKERIKKLIKEIKESDFPPKPGGHCQFCDFSEICPYSSFGRR